MTAFSQSVLGKLIGMLGIIAATMNVVAGFEATDRDAAHVQGRKS